MPAGLTAQDIAACLSRAALEKARAYHAEGRVMTLAVEADDGPVTAEVRGSGRHVYDVTIAVRSVAGRVDRIAGECSCPVGFNCKHVGATLLALLASRPRQGGLFASTSSAPDFAPLQAAALPEPISFWLDRLGVAARGDDYAEDVTQRLLYAFRPHRLGDEMPGLAVAILSHRLLKDGSYSNKAAQVSLSAFNPDRPPKFYRGSDIEIMSLLRKDAPYGGQGATAFRSIDIARRIVETGRAAWLESTGAPLIWGEPREGRIEWQLTAQGQVRPKLIVDGATGLNALPPVYVDPAAGRIGPVELGLPTGVAHRLLEAPPIAPALVARVATGLAGKLPGIRPALLPVPLEPALRIEQDPKPVLHLRLGRGAYDYYDKPKPVAIASVHFRYDAIELKGAALPAVVEIVHDGRLHEVVRRPAKEKAARARAKRCGFVAARTAHSHLNIAHADDLSFPAARDWLDFLDGEADALRAEGFTIRVDDDFPYRLARASDFPTARIEGSGIDWFELDLGVEIDGVRHDLIPAIAALVGTPGFDPDRLAMLAGEDDKLYLSLTDGRLLAVAAVRLLPILMALHMLDLGGPFADRRGRPRFALADALPLLGLEDGTFAFDAADKLRRLAGLLHADGLQHPVLPATFGAVLRPYQAEGVAWLDLLRESGLGGILADDMGLGKTVQLLALLALEKARGALTAPALIVAPTSLMANWRSEAQRFAPDLRVLVLHGTARKQAYDSIADHDLVLTTYPLIARDRDVLMPRDWHMAILDEAQTIKNPNAATTRWLAGIKARHRFCLTGTPMENHLGELWSLMSFVNPGYLGDKAGFARAWRTPIEKRGDTARSKMLAKRIKPFLLRRTKAEVVTELPPKTEIVESIILEGKQRDAYESIRVAMSEKVRKALRERGLGKSHIIILEALLKLRQACCDPALLKLADGVERPSAKLERLMEMVAELLSEGRKIIIFSQFTTMLDLIRMRLEAGAVSYSLLTGQTRDRPAAVAQFQTGPADVFLISLKAGGVGLNLTAADTVIIYDPWWNPAVEEQAIDRAHRIGQDKPIFVYRLVAAGTIEEKMDELKARKRMLAAGLYDDEGRLDAALTEDDVNALFDA